MASAQLSRSSSYPSSVVRSSFNPYATESSPSEVSNYEGILAQRGDSYLFLWEGYYYPTWGYANSVDKQTKGYLTWILCPKELKKVKIGAREEVVWWRKFEDTEKGVEFLTRYETGQRLGDPRSGTQM
jgi:hypothetical protein